MADILTKKSTREVTLTPLDGSGRSFVVFGLGRERVQFSVPSPTRRVLSQAYVTQQRKVSRRRYTLTFTVFEPNIQSNGRFGKLDRGAFYEQRGSRVSRNVTARHQLETIHSLAKLQQEGVLFAYAGIAIGSERVAIVDFDADMVYATGTGTLTLEERPENQVDIENIAISVEAAENALRQLTQAEDEETLEPIDLFGTTPANAAQYLQLVHAFQAEVLAQKSFTSYIPTDDLTTLTQYGLPSNPLYFRTDDGPVQIFPRDPTFRVPKLRILPLRMPAWGAAAARGIADTGAIAFNVSVAVAGLFIDFQIKPYIGRDHKRFWECTAWVFTEPIPLYEIREEEAPIIDPSVDPKVDPAKAADLLVGPPVPAGDPRNIAFRPENSGRFKDAPRNVISCKVEMGREVDLSDQLTFAFMPKNSNDWDAPTGTGIRDWALVIGDYRT